MAWVERYAAFGPHHTGTDADANTTAWLKGELESLGAVVELEPYSFDRFVVESELTDADGAIVPSVPLFYSAVGTWDSPVADVIELPLRSVGSASGIDSLLRSEGDSQSVVIAIDGPDDLPVQCNRLPTRLLGRPAVVIAANWAARVRSGARMQFEARLASATSANIVASLGAIDAPPVTVTTPLTGWTPAAGERGTGLAAALAACADLQSDHRVTFVACSGHELDHIGLRHYLARHNITGPTIHLGASVAAVEHGADGAALADTRMVLTTATGDRRHELAKTVVAANWALADRDPPWPGEGGTWVEAGASVLSFLGSFSLFHTMDDVPDRATTPEALALATSTAQRAVRQFLAGRVD